MPEKSWDVWPTTADRVGLNDPYGALLTAVILWFSDSVTLLKVLASEGLLGLCRNSGSDVRSWSPKVWRHWEGRCKPHHFLALRQPGHFDMPLENNLRVLVSFWIIYWWKQDQKFWVVFFCLVVWLFFCCFFFFSWEVREVLMRLGKKKSEYLLSKKHQKRMKNNSVFWVKFFNS